VRPFQAEVEKNRFPQRRKETRKDKVKLNTFAPLREPPFPYY
jgi:hypothetical protein